jgi:hypothetical protein
MTINFSYTTIFSIILYILLIADFSSHCSTSCYSPLTISYGLSLLYSHMFSLYIFINIIVDLLDTCLIIDKTKDYLGKKYIEPDYYFEISLLKKKLIVKIKY